MDRTFRLGACIREPSSLGATVSALIGPTDRNSRCAQLSYLTLTTAFLCICVSDLGPCSAVSLLRVTDLPHTLLIRRQRAGTWVPICVLYLSVSFPGRPGVMNVTIRTLPHVSLNLLFGDFSGTSFNAKFLWFPMQIRALLEAADACFGHWQSWVLCCVL